MGLGFKILMGIVIATAALTTWSFYKTTGKNGKDENGENKNGKNGEGKRPNPVKRDSQGPKAPEGLGQGGDENGN